MILEHVTFRLKNECDFSEYVTVVQCVTHYLESCSGFIKREVGYNKQNDLWVDLVWWDNIESASLAAKEIASDRRGAAFLDCMDKTTVTFNYFEVATAVES